MAKTSSVEKNNRRRKLVKQYANKRAKLKAVIQNKELPIEERFAAQLQPLPLGRISGAVVAGGVMIHALLHGLEAPVDASSVSWWVGAVVGSCVVSAGSWLLLRRLV